MEAVQNHRPDDGHTDLVAELPGQVLVALDHLTPDERASVFAALQAFARGQREGTRVPGAEPLYVLRAAPEVLVFVRRPPAGRPVEAVDILRPAAVRTLGHAR